MRIGQLADRFEGAGNRLAAGAGALAGTDPGAAAFGGDQPGRIGAVGRMLHQRVSVALGGREREAAAHGARLVDTADLLRTAAARYESTEAAARARHGSLASPGDKSTVADGRP
jgi:hypothetical protein